MKRKRWAFPVLLVVILFAGCTFPQINMTPASNPDAVSVGVPSGGPVTVGLPQPAVDAITAGGQVATGVATGNIPLIISGGIALVGALGGIWEWWKRRTGDVKLEAVIIGVAKAGDQKVKEAIETAAIRLGVEPELHVDVKAITGS